jgi:hypothetical protein
MITLNFQIKSFFIPSLGAEVAANEKLFEGV